MCSQRDKDTLYCIIKTFAEMQRSFLYAMALCDALQLEWENDRDEYLEMEILEDVVNVFQIDSDGNEVQKIIEFDSETINKTVRDFYDII